MLGGFACLDGAAHCRVKLVESRLKVLQTVIRCHGFQPHLHLLQPGHTDFITRVIFAHSRKEFIDKFEHDIPASTKQIS